MEIAFKKNRQLLVFSILILLVIPTLVVAECTCDEEDEGRDRAKALRYKIAALISILVASAIGVCTPLLGKVIPCLKDHPWGDFPFAGFVAMCTAMGTLMVDTYATAYFQKHHLRKAQAVEATDVEKESTRREGNVDLHTHATHGHAHGHVSSDPSSELLRHRVISQVLELGIVVHSVIIGISLGASESPNTIKPLVAALTFHQFFEGMGLGSCMTQANLKKLSVSIMGLFFALTTPVGIVIGIGISNVYDESSPTALIVEGIFNAASSGILIYMALVDLLAADFMHPRMQNSGKLRLGSNLSLLLGAGCMAVIAKWA